MLKSIPIHYCIGIVLIYNFSSDGTLYRKKQESPVDRI